MASHHLSSKSLEPYEKIALAKLLEEEIKKDNEKKIREGFSKEKREEKASSLQMEGGSDVNRDTWSDNQIAKKAGVGIGTVARYNQVMKSDNEDLKEKVKKGEVKIGTAYINFTEFDVSSIPIQPNILKSLILSHL